MAKKQPVPSHYGLATKNKTQYLYTKGFEFSLDGANYIGEYNKQSNMYWTGPVKTSTSKKLTKYYGDPMLYAYDKARDFAERVRVIPNQIVLIPTDRNYERGFIVRYFVERSGNFQSYPIEIDEQQASAFGTEGGIDEGLYSLAKIQWKLTGSERSYYLNPYTLIEGIFEHNQRQVYESTRIIPNLMYAVKNYTEFARITVRSQVGS